VRCAEKPVPTLGGFPPRRKHAARQQETLARINAVGSPKRGLMPPCVSPAQTSEARNGSRNFLLCAK
jgi:hypothetical protein